MKEHNKLVPVFGIDKGRRLYVGEKWISDSRFMLARGYGLKGRKSENKVFRMLNDLEQGVYTDFGTTDQGFIKASDAEFPAFEDVFAGRAEGYQEVYLRSIVDRAGLNSSGDITSIQFKYGKTIYGIGPCYFDMWRRLSDCEMKIQFHIKPGDSKAPFLLIYDGEVVGVIMPVRI